jgi:hypothetical protein
LDPKKVKPMFHIDFHGKYDREKQSIRGNIDCALLSMNNYFTKADRENVVEPLGKSFKKKINKIYKDKKVGLDHLKGRAEIDPDLDGFWGYNRHSMNSQCSKAGIPSLQLEIPPDFRKNLADSDKMIDAWATAII